MHSRSSRAHLPNLGNRRVDGDARALSRRRQGCVKVGLGGGRFGIWSAVGGRAGAVGGGTGNVLPLNQRFLYVRTSISAAGVSSAPLYPPRRCHCPCPYLCPAAMISAPSAKHRCLPADASWSPPLHGCHRLVVCYRERRPLPLLADICHSALRQGRRQSCVRDSEAGAACVRTLQERVVLLWWCGGEALCVCVLMGAGGAKPPRRPTDDRQFGVGQPTLCTARSRCLA